MAATQESDQTFSADAQSLLGCFNSDGQRGSTALGEEGHQHCWHHALHDMKWIESANRYKQGQDHEELNDIAAQYHQHILANGFGYYTGRQLRRQLRREGQSFSSVQKY